MKRVLAWGIIIAYLAFLGILIYSAVNSSTEIKEVKIEPIEKQIEPYDEPSMLEVEVIMGELVKESKEERIRGFEITYDEAQMLMKIAQAEAGCDGKDGMAMVMAVVLNRVEDDRFPDSIEEVIFQEHQFSPIADGRYEKAQPDVECHLALAEIERGEYNTVDALYFENDDASWQASNCIYLGTIGHHRFYKN